MEESKYLELRAKLRAQVDQDIANREFLRRFVLALVGFINREAGRDQDVCAYGSIKPEGGFVEEKMNGYGSTIAFAIEMRFHDVAGVQIFQHAVPFKASFKDNVLTIQCLESLTGEKLRLTHAEYSTDDGKRAVAALLDEPVRQAVDEVLKKSNSI